MMEALSRFRCVPERNAKQARATAAANTGVSPLRNYVASVEMTAFVGCGGRTGESNKGKSRSFPFDKLRVRMTISNWF